MANKLIDHLPPRLAEIKEIADIQEAIEPELNDILKVILKLLNNRIPQMADSDGVLEWEEWLGIEPDDTLSLDERRTNILLKLNSRIPYTEVQLHRILATAVGWDNYNFTVEDFELVVDIALIKEDKLPIVQNILQQIVPAHILKKYRLSFTTTADVYLGAAYTMGKTLVFRPNPNREPFYGSGGINSGVALVFGRQIMIGGHKD